MVELDASHGEGGGQLVRTAVALSALTGRPLRLVNVRAKRPKPGLAPQHLAAVRAVAALCQARCDGLELGASAFTFAPRARFTGGTLRVEVGTAGSVTLVLQALLPVLLAASGPSRVEVGGGTDVRRAPAWDYFREVLLPLLGRMEARVRAAILRRGYYPAGGGEIAVEVEPGAMVPLTLAAPAKAWRIGGEAHVSRLPVAIAERMCGSAERALGAKGALRPRAVPRDEAAGPGGAITLWAESDTGLLGACRVAERGVRAETLGEDAGRELAADLASGATVDVHAADQLLVHLALAKGVSRFTTREVSSHARTGMWLIPQFFDAQFDVAQEGALWCVTCTAA